MSWHLDYFARLGALYRIAIIAALLLIAAFSLFYVRYRKRGLWRWELRIAVALTTAVVVVHSPVASAVCIWIVVAGYCVGARILRRLIVEAPPLAALALSIGVGLGAFILALIPTGLAGLYGTGSFAAMLLAATVVFRRELLSLQSLILDLDDRWSHCEELQSPLVGIGVSFLPAFALAFLMAALAPSIAYDATAHHLPAARHYLLGGTLEPLPLLEGAFDGRSLFFLGHSVAYSYYPQSFEELLTLAMGLGGQQAAQLIPALFFVLTLMTVAAIASLCKCSTTAVVVGAIASASLPFANWAGAIVKNDYAMAFFVLSALYCVLRARERAQGWLLLSAYFLGLSFGVKHVALFGAIPIGLLILYRVRQRSRSFRLAVVLAAVFIASGLFWHARTYALTGSPTYPAGVSTVGVSRGAVDGSQPSVWSRHLRYPWLAHFDGHKVLESPTANPLGFYFPFFCICWVLTRRREYTATDRAVLLFLALYYVYWIYVWGVLRYAIAPILLLVTLLAERVVIVSSQSPLSSRATSTIFAYCLSFALLPTLILQVNAFQFPYFAGKLDRAGYLRATNADYRPIEILNQKAEPEDRTLSINNCAAAYAYSPSQFRCVRLDGVPRSEKGRLIQWLVESTGPEYLMLPAEYGLDELLQPLDRLGYRKPIYDDERYLLFSRDGGGD